MNTEQQTVQSKPGISLPPVNEIMAIRLGACLADPEKRAWVEEEVLQKFEKFDVVLKQNTADTVNIVVPDFESVNRQLLELSEADLEGVAGGEVILGSLIIAFGSIGVFFGIGTATAVVSATTGAVIGTMFAVTSVVAGIAITGLVAGIAVTGATAIGLGVAHALGALGSAAASDASVSVGLNS